MKPPFLLVRISVELEEPDHPYPIALLFSVRCLRRLSKMALHEAAPPIHLNKLKLLVCERESLRFPLRNATEVPEGSHYTSFEFPLGIRMKCATMNV